MPTDNNPKLPSIAKLLLTMGASLSGQVNPALALSAQYLAFENQPIRIPEMEMLINMSIRGIIDDKDYKTFMRYLGYDPNWIPIIENTFNQTMSPVEYVQLWRRGMITEKQLDNYLKITKYYNEKSNIINMTTYHPTIPDLVRFAVREAYSPEVIKKFGNLDELPEKFVSEAKLQGLGIDQAKNYWSSHWELPSMQMGFEMLHRTTHKKIDDDADEITMPSGDKIYNVIGTKTMDTLIKTLDITPFWRSKLKEISYNPLTRVDVRRMYSMGVIDEDKVFTSYLDEGYNEENALLLTNFVTKEYAQEMNGITRSVLEKAFKEDLLTVEEFRDNLIKLKLSPDTADFFVSLAEYDKHMNDIKILVDRLSIQYSEGLITLDDVRAKITLENVPTSFVENVVTKITKAKSTSRKIPSLADCQRWYKGKLISKEDFLARLKIIGYNEIDSNLYEMEISGK
jgi:hypothetical protein